MLSSPPASKSNRLMGINTAHLCWDGHVLMGDGGKGAWLAIYKERSKDIGAMLCFLDTVL